MDMTTRSTQAVNSAVKLAAERGNPAVEPAHLAVALLDDAETLTRPLLQAVGAEPTSVRADLSRLVDKYPSASGANVAAPAASRNLLAVLGAAEREARDRSRRAPHPARGAGRPRRRAPAPLRRVRPRRAPPPRPRPPRGGRGRGPAPARPPPPRAGRRAEARPRLAARHHRRSGGHVPGA